MLKNLTVSLDKDCYRKAKVAAAERGQSVSAMVRDYFNSLESVPASSPSPRASKTTKSGSLLEALGDERLADVDFEMPRFGDRASPANFS